MPAAQYRHHNGVRRDDLTSREYVKEWERLADTSKAKFSCLDAIVETTGRVTSLWSGTLPDGRELFIISVDRPAEHPHYDRGVGDRDEALTYFSRFRPATVA